MDSKLLARRQAQLFRGIKDSRFDAVGLIPGPSFFYFTGLGFHLSERPIVAWFRPDRPVGFVLPEFEATKISGLSYHTHLVTYSENPDTWVEAFRKLVVEMNLNSGRLGGEPLSMRMLELDYIRSAAPDIAVSSAEVLISGIRINKDSVEVAAMREAVKIAESAVRTTLAAIAVGMTEGQVASRLTAELLNAGSDPELPFSPIVGFGPNSARPHHFPTDRTLGDDDLILIDWGARKSGYVSDMTRVFSASDNSGKYQEIAQIVSRANLAAQSKAAPGIAVMELDHAARDLIEKSGYGKQFAHRTGHGLGLEAHEPPYIRGDNSEILEPGMSFTIEPGIYLPGEFGVRIEDNVLVTQDGSICLTDLPHELLSISHFR